MTPESARDAYDGMDDETQTEARRLIRLGRDRIEVVKSLHKQSLARDGVEAEDEAIGPTTGERVASRAMGIAEGAQTGLAPFGTDGEGLKKTAMFLPMSLPVVGAMHAIKGLSGASEGAEAAKAQDPNAFGEGEIIGSSASAALGAPSAAKAVAAIPGALKGATGTAGLRIKGAFGEMARETLDGGAAPTKFGATMRTLKALAGKGGDAEKLVIESADLADEVVPFKMPANLAAQMDELAKAPTKKSPLVKFLPAADDARAAQPARAEMPADVMAGGAPKSARAAAVERIAKEDVGSAIEKGGGVPSFPGRPAPKGVTIDPLPNFLTADEVAAATRLRRPDPRAQTPTPAARPRGEAEMKAAVAEGVKRGVPLKELAKQLGVNQGDIAAWFKGAQLGF